MGNGDAPAVPPGGWVTGAIAVVNDGTVMRRSKRRERARGANPCGTPPHAHRARAAGRAGSDHRGARASHLHRIETGQRALDSRAQIVALANALQISPSELTSLPVPAPGNGETDAAIQALGLALMAASHGLPGGQVLPAETLKARVTTTIDALCRCERERGRRLSQPPSCSWRPTGSQSWKFYFH